MSKILPAADEVVDAACDLVALWEEQRIAGLPRAERNAAIEGVRERLVRAVRRLTVEREGV